MKVLDVGAGPGIYVKALRDAGIEADGVDVDERTPYDRCDVFSANFEKYYNRGYDLVMSIEVAEHLPESRASDFVWRLTSVGAPTILFTAAQVGQGGIGHINCQPKEYWREKFAEYNYEYDDAATRKLVEWIGWRYHMVWFRNNAQVFRRKPGYGANMYETIIAEETQQAVNLATYIRENPNL